MNDQVPWILANNRGKMLRSGLRRSMAIKYADRDPILEELEKEGRIRIDANMISSK
jgi:hypothetical protein